jgi:predicted  nucleic acid-binding Zn-ribbon protein
LRGQQAKSGLVLYAVNGVEIPLTKFTMSWDKGLDIQEIDLSIQPNGTYFLKLPDATEGIKLVKGN